MCFHTLNIVPILFSLPGIFFSTSFLGPTTLIFYCSAESPLLCEDILSPQERAVGFSSLHRRTPAFSFKEPHHSVLMDSELLKGSGGLMLILVTWISF